MKFYLPFILYLFSVTTLSAKNVEREIISDYFLFHSFTKLNNFQIDSTLVYLQWAIRKNPKNDVAYFSYAKTLQDLGYTKQALLAAQKAYELDTSNYWYIANYAEKAYLLRDTLLLQKLYHKLFVQMPQIQQNYIDYAKYAFELGQYQNAINTLNLAKQQFGNDFQTTVLLKNIYATKGDQEKAFETIFDYIKNKDSLSIEPYLEFFELAVYFQQEDYADYALQKAREIDPNNLIVLLIETDITLLRSQYDLFVTALSKLFYHPEITQSVFHKYLSILFQQPVLVKKYTTTVKKFIEHYNQIFPSISSTYFQARYLLVENLIDSTLNIAAQNVLTVKNIFDNLNTDPSEDKVKLFLANASLENYESAYNSYFLMIDILQQKLLFSPIINLTTDMLPIFPNHKFNILFVRAYTYLKMKKYDLAKTDFLELKNQYEQNVIDTAQYLQIGFSLAEIAVAQSNKKELSNLYKQLLKLVPDNPMVMNNYAFHLSQLNTDLKKAKKYILKTLEIEPDNYIYLDTYAVILFMLKDYETSRSVFRKALALGGNNEPEILDNYADLLFYLKDYTNAEVYWKKAFELSNDEDIRKKLEDMKRKP